MSKATRRFGIVIILFTVFVLLLVAQYFKVMVLEPDKPEPERTIETSSERGPILDRNGRILAMQTRLFSVTAWVPNIENSTYTAETLAPILKLDAEMLKRRIDQSRGFLYIKRKVSPSTREKVRRLIADRKLPGISLEPEYGRNYPEQDLAAHVLGFVGTDNVGLDGIELTYNDTLAPSADAEDNAPVKYGNQLFLTLDLNIQYMAEEVAQKTYEEYDANSVMVLVMDARNGEILGWANSPDFDPNTFNRTDVFAKNNRPVTYAYEPGSVFKIFSIASLLELGALAPDTEFYCNGYYEREFPNADTVHINCLGTHGTVNAQTILQYSCNAGAAYASDLVSKEEFHRQITEFGFGSKTHLPFPGETGGIFSEPERWSGRTKPTIAIGQEISVTALQMITAATAFTNQGMLLQPHIVKKIVSPDGKIIQENKREPIRQAVRPEVAEASLLMMETVTADGGTAHRARIDGIRMSAKTGTAQKIDPRTGNYSENSFVASTMAIYPTDDPRLITYIVIDTPQGDEFYGGRIAAPMIRELGLKLIPYMGIPTENEEVIRHSGVVKLKQQPQVEIGASLPDLRGISKRRLLPLLSHEDIDAIFRGEGWVKSQDPEPGTPVTKNMQLILEFE
ncbi:MAG: peptidoglycan glycosyltransferase [Spirochaetaceae bacterium]|nr:peptidoglycan glycosyltransferase [Spirochaetaceae bacterium]MCF7950106.1 peptidoglycan glycosyltransferase [Spirochaetaceae bacterium]